MSFSRPTISELIARIQADFVSKLEIVGAVLRRAMIRVLSIVIAGAAHLLHGHIEFLGKQLFPDTSTDEFFLRQAALFGFTQNAADYAHASVTFTGTNGEIIAEDELFILNGLEYSLDADTDAISGGTTTGLVTALLAGSAGTLSPGAVLSFESPQAGVDSAVTVIESTDDGTDQETIPELKVRFLEFLRTPSHAGSENDYVMWAKQVSGVTRVWPYPLGLGPGTVLFYFVRDNDVTIIPGAGEVTEVQDYVDVLKPAHATVTAAAPAGATLDVELSITPDTVAMRALVEASLADFILRVASPRRSSDADSGTILLSQLRTAVGLTPGLTDYTMTDPVADVVSAEGELVTGVNLTWL